MMAFLTYILGLLIGVLIMAVAYRRSGVFDAIKEAKGTLESPEEALEEGYITINELPKE